MTSSYRDLSQLQRSLKEGQVTVSGLVRHYLKNIESSRDLNQYIEVYEEEALHAAAALDEKIKTGQPLGKLFGLILSHKDIISYKGHALTASSNILEGYTALFHATVIERALAEDAILIGRVQCDEFAMGSSNENSRYGPVRNPFDKERIPGGSSGASATSVASDTCWASLGTDTGGSVRQPAAFCGLVGFKPGYGRISRHGLIAYASSFDQAGFLTRSVYDAALLLEVAAGYDGHDASMGQATPEQYSQALDVPEKPRLAYLDLLHFKDAMDPAILKNYHETLESWKNKGFALDPVALDWLDYVIPAYYVMTTAEASSNLSRYDGIRYGYRADDATTLEQLYKRTRTRGFGTEVKRRILLGTYVLSAGFYDAYYQKAQKVRRLVRNRLDELFRQYDALVMPVSPTLPWKIGEKIDDPVSVYLADIFTVLANVAGLPGISLPTGVDARGLPIGTQLVGGQWKEQKLLRIAHALTLQE
ncbi:MAG TPA: Asp-tRNA(Asn)/Glu-tRNA(Gln) amidotransferase subunit GatA [Saprospiraceae bacterium]|nr:Asp-tRNA(Asn)/Glu-tRNA(Gln) amidotransferase subunit GatA [Saprospiraceae bacterium]